MSSLKQTIEIIRTSGFVTRLPRPYFIVALSFALWTMGMVGPQRLCAEQHVVTLEEIHQQLRGAHETRASHVGELQRFFSSDAVKKGLATVGFHSSQVATLVSYLDDDELARLAERTRAIDRDLAAGALSNEHLTYIVIALATAVVVILAT